MGSKTFSLVEEPHTDLSDYKLMGRIKREGGPSAGRGNFKPGQGNFINTRKDTKADQRNQVKANSEKAFSTGLGGDTFGSLEETRIENRPVTQEYAKRLIHERNALQLSQSEFASLVQVNEKVIKALENRTHIWRQGDHHIKNKINGKVKTKLPHE